MKIGDLVFDSSIGQRGIIIDSKLWENNVFCDDKVHEHFIFYEDGDFEWAYENEIEVVNAGR